MWSVSAGDGVGDVGGRSGTGLTTTGSQSESASGARSNTSASGAEKTSTQKSKRPGGRPPLLTQRTKVDVAVMRAEGMTRAAIAKALGISPDTVKRAERSPDVQQRMTELRTLWKAVAHRAIEATAPVAWEMAHESARQHDPKAFDYTLRGLHAMEKISHSVSGEGSKVEVSGPDGTPLQVDARVILAQIAEHLAKKKHEEP